MRILLAKFFRLLFKLNMLKPKFFGVHQRIFKRYNLFQGVVQTIDYNGFQLTLHIDDWIQENIYFLGAYEKAELKAVSGILRPGDVFLDLGANLGLYSLHASRIVGESGKVISFEPFSTNFNALKEHVAMNQLSNVQLEKLAVGKESGMITLYLNESEGNLGMVTASYIENAIKEEVKIVSIDAYRKEKKLQKVDFIKIDIEGFEYPTLLGMENTLNAYLPSILIEILDESKSPQNENKVEVYLMGFGYKKFYINDNGELSETDENPVRRNYLFTTREVGKVIH